MQGVSIFFPSVMHAACVGERPGIGFDCVETLCKKLVSMRWKNVSFWESMIVKAVERSHALIFFLLVYVRRFFVFDTWRFMYGKALVCMLWPFRV